MSEATKPASPKPQDKTPDVNEPSNVRRPDKPTPDETPEPQG